jgi:hypothetical protein
MQAQVAGLGWWLLLGLGFQACHSAPRFPESELIRIRSDERVDDWRVSGETGCPRDVRAITGCYVLEVRYREDYTRVRGGVSQLWAFSPIAGAVDTAVSTHSTRYEIGYVLFALPLRRERNYYVTATFDGDKFMPRIVETNAAEERTSEILPAGSMQELERCKAQAPSVSASEQEVCAVPLNQSPERKW